MKIVSSRFGRTHHFLNAANIGRLPQGAIVVNAARGGLIVDDDLIAALKSGHIAAAGLDVYEGEPRLHPGYIGLKNTFLLPHVGTATIESRTNMGMVALDNIHAVLHGRPAHWRRLRSIGQSDWCLLRSPRFSVLTLACDRILPHDVDAIYPIISPTVRMFFD